ncbi:unnamed protein product [Linum trigynum]|uniref:Uncharacterized protein n=1 Tax=Linum trigynum TaxID=586398 RepID=A0AAV2CZT4_9ROSI
MTFCTIVREKDRCHDSQIATKKWGMISSASEAQNDKARDHDLHFPNLAHELCQFVRELGRELGEMKSIVKFLV